MWINKNIIYIHVEVPHIPHITLYMPFMIFIQLFDCVLDIMALASWLAPHKPIAKHSYTVKEIYRIAFKARCVIGNTNYSTQEDFVNVSLGKQNILVRVKIL